MFSEIYNSCQFLTPQDFRLYNIFYLSAHFNNIPLLGLSGGSWPGRSEAAPSLAIT